MPSELQQPWRVYISELSAQRDVDEEACPPEQEQEERLELCPGGVECSMKPHPLGSTNACAKATAIGTVFLNSTG